MVFRFSVTRSFASVTRCTSSGVTPGATSHRTNPVGVTSITASSVTIRSTTPTPVRGRAHCLRIFGFPSLVVCSMAMIDTPGSGNQVHRPAHALQFLAGDGPIREIPLLIDLHPTQHRDVHMAATNHGERVRAIEIARPANLGDGLLPGVDQIRIHLILEWIWSDPEHAVLRFQDYLHALRDMVGNQDGYADTEVRVVAVTHLLCDATGNPLLGRLPTLPSVIASSFHPLCM